MGGSRFVRMGIDLSVDGSPLLGTYAAQTLEDLRLVSEAGMNLVIGGSEFLDERSETGSFLQKSGIKVMYHLTHHIYGRPRLGDRIDSKQEEIPLLAVESRALPPEGLVQVEDELIYYSKYTPNSLKGCERGYDGTEPQEHREGQFLFLPEECAKEVEAVRDSPNLWGYYVLDDSPGDALSALKALYSTIRSIEGDRHHPVCAGYGSAGSLCNLDEGVCDAMLIYWYPVNESGYDRLATSLEVQWMLTAARAKVPGMPFIGVYQAFWGGGATEPSPRQLREQVEDYVREGSDGLVAFACNIKEPYGGWAKSTPLREEIGRINREIGESGGLEVPPEPEVMAASRIQPPGRWTRPRPIDGIIPAWHIVGPFDDSSRSRLQAEFPPERGVDLEATYQGKYGPVHWIVRESQAGTVGLCEIFGDQRQVADCIAYATCKVLSPADQNVILSLGSDDDISVRVNGVEIWRHEGVRGVKRDEDQIRISLPAGWSTILLKVCNRTGMWGFFARFLNEEKKPLRGLKFSPTA